MTELQQAVHALENSNLDAAWHLIRNAQNRIAAPPSDETMTAFTGMPWRTLPPSRQHIEIQRFRETLRSHLK